VIALAADIMIAVAGLACIVGGIASGRANGDWGTGDRTRRTRR
jgi:hypothetical protein